MNYRRLGKTNLRISVVGIGAWQLGGEWGKDFTRDEADRIFEKARQLGINLIDTAECYGDHLSEKLIGQAIARDRDKWIVATKFGHKFISPMQREEPRSPQDVLRQLDDSLRALRTDYIDLYQYHSWGETDFDNFAVAEALHRQMEAGRIRHLGNSVGGSGESAPRQIEQSPRYRIESIQMIYNRLDRRPEQRLLPLCQQLDLGVMARVPLASGFLSGKYEAGDRFAPSDVRSRMSGEQIDAKLREVEQIRRNEVPPGIDMATWALAWCLQHSAVTCVIPGCKTPEQVEANARAAEMEMVRDDHPQAWKE